MIEALEILNETSKNVILKIDQFKGVLKEYMYRDIVRTGKSEESMVEVFLENYRKKLDILERVELIPDVYIPNYNIFIRMTSLNKLHTYNMKFTLEQGIKLYETDENVQQVQLLNSNQKISMASIGLICSFMVHKAESWNVSTTTEASTDTKRSLNKQMVLPWTNLTLKLNCNLDMQFRVDHQHLCVDRFLIYRDVLSSQPLQMISIVYYEKKEYFMLYLYDVSSSWITRKKVKMVEVKAYVPYVKQMLNLKLYQELGARIHKAFKNRLILHSYTSNPMN